ncbi:MAG TPA: Rieske 2Fe-2S domain-containing protein [Candidatus Limnocylindrales bacterium]|nr:Rieske 2Fe-2S domain-containing protein [Candidatus Limnocylindrales bacterium]
MLERLARPLRGLSNGIAGVTGGFYRVLGGPGRLLQDFLNGSWLGHSLHAVLVDVVIGGATAALLLDVLRVFFSVDGLEDAATWVLGLAWLAGIGAILSGLTDYKDTAPDSAERDVAGLHGVVNFLGNAGFGISVFQRLGGGHDLAFWVLLIAYVVISFGSYIGGHVVFKHGYMVNHNAFNRGKRAREFTPAVAVAEVPEGKPTKIMFGTTAVVLVRRGDVVHALKETCSHAGGPLSEGELKGDAITCPWHFSTFRLADGSVVHGPANSRQVSYRARINGDQVELQGPHD